MTLIEVFYRFHTATLSSPLKNKKSEDVYKARVQTATQVQMISVCTTRLFVLEILMIITYLYGRL